jgi:hypothetical protein
MIVLGEILCESLDSVDTLVPYRRLLEERRTNCEAGRY